MQYALEIRSHNQQPHIDIENDIQLRRNGLFTFILRVNNGNIVDFNVMEYSDGTKYISLTRVTRIIKRNLLFHVLVENEVQQTPFGQLTFNIMIKEGVAQIETLNLVKSKRRKYNLTKDKDSDIP